MKVYLGKFQFRKKAGNVKETMLQTVFQVPFDGKKDLGKKRLTILAIST